jgi:glycosyltransferase involved in cell wall biosynthesis
MHDDASRESGTGNTLLSILIPAYNEKETLESLVSKVMQVPLSKEIIIIDDGSDDGTTHIIEQLEQERKVRAIYSKKNQGKGMAIRLGIETAIGDVLIIQDADMEYDPMEIETVVRPILSNQTDVCYGSRILGRRQGLSEESSALRYYVGGRLVSLITSLLYGQIVTDEPTCYKAFKMSVLRKIPLDGTGFELEPELTAKVLRSGFRFHEVPITYHPRRPGQGKKLNWVDGLKAIATLLVWRFRPFQLRRN